MNKSKFLSLALIALFVLSLTFSAYAAESTGSQLTFAVEASASSVKAGDEITFSVYLDKNPGFKWGRAELHFDPAALTYKSATMTGSIFAGNAYVTEIGINELSKGLLKCTMGDMYAALGAGNVNYTGTGMLFSATFIVAEGYTGNISVTATASSTNIRDLNNQIGTITVNSDVCTVSLVSEGHVHTPVDAPAVEPTCGAPGKTKGSYCATCGAILVPQEEIPALEHTRGEAVKENEVPASCSADGSYDYVVYCTVCSQEIERKTYYVASTGEHNFATEVERVDASCTTDGYVVMSCACGMTQRTEITALGHQEEVLEGYSATCMDSGLTEGKYCTVCGEITLAQAIIPAADHDREVLPGYAATCTEPGKTQGIICAVCDTVLEAQSEIPATGHTAINVSAVPPTCSSTGYTDGSICNTCGITISGREVVDKLAHTEAILPYVAPTCSAVGYEEGVYCSVCDQILVAQVEIPATDHSSEVIAAVDPTCSSVGWTEGAKCSVCGEILNAPTEIEKLEHTVVTGEPVAPTCTEAGAYSSDFCSTCGEIVSYGGVIPALGHTYNDNGVCISCGEEEGCSNHVFGEWVISKEPTKDALGERVRTCANCNFKETQAIATVSGGSTALIVGIAFVVMIACVVVIVVLVRKKK